MKRSILFLLLGILISLNLACQDDSGDSTAGDSTAGDSTAGDSTASNPEDQAAATEHPALTAANNVLSAIHAGDAAAIRPLLNATNQEKVSDEDLPRLLVEAKREVGDVTEVTEVRAGRRENEVLAKIKVLEEEVFVVVLTLEDGKYLFEDLNSPATADYEALEKIAP